MQNGNISENWLLIEHLLYRMVQMVKIIIQGRNRINNQAWQNWINVINTGKECWLYIKGEEFIP